MRSEFTEKEAAEYNTIQHLKRLQEMIDRHNLVTGEHVRISDVSVYEPGYQTSLATEGAAVAYATANPKIIEESQRNTRDKFFTNLIASSPKTVGPRPELSREYASTIESLRNASGDMANAVALTKDGMRDAKAFRPQYNDDQVQDPNAILTASGKKYRADRGLPDQINPKSPTEFPAFASSMTLKFSDRTAFDLWFAANSSVKMLSDPSVNMDDGSVSVEVGSDYVNSSGTSMTNDVRGGGPYGTRTRTK